MSLRRDDMCQGEFRWLKRELHTVQSKLGGTIPSEGDDPRALRECERKLKSQIVALQASSLIRLK